MEQARRFVPGPTFQYKGNLVSAFLYFKGNSDLVHSWDIVIRGANLSKDTDAREALGLTDDDMTILNARVQQHVDFKEGRR